MSIMKSDTGINTGRPDGSVTAGQLGNLHGSGSPVCDLTSAVVAAGTSAATSAPVLAVSHRGETMHVPALHYGSDGSGSGSSFLTPARRARSRGTSPAASDAPMHSGSIKRSAPESPLMDEGPHPFRIAKPRVEAEAPEGENATWQQHVRHLELHVDSLNTFATALIEQTLPQVKSMFERMAVIENNFQNVGQNTEQLVATSVRDHHQEMKEHLARVEGSVPDMQRRVEEVMNGAAERIEKKLRELVSDDQRIEQALKHVAGCTEQEVEKIKASQA